MYRINSKHLSFTSAKQNQARSFYSVREPSCFWYEVMANSKAQAKGLKRKVTEMLNVTKSAANPASSGYADPSCENESSVSLCARTIAIPEIPSKYRKSLKPLVVNDSSSFIKESHLMDIPSKSRDYDRFNSLREMDEMNQVKKKFANSLHIKNVSGMMLKADGFSYYMHKPSYYTMPEPYEIPDLKSDLMKMQVARKTRKLRLSSSDTGKKNKKDNIFTPKRLRKYAD